MSDADRSWRSREDLPRHRRGAAVALARRLRYRPRSTPARRRRRPRRESTFDAGQHHQRRALLRRQRDDAAEVQGFLNAAVSRCRAGYTCLKDYRQATRRSAPARPAAATRTRAAERVAPPTIIAKVGVACGISQKALLVLLEKEQSLVTDTWPTSTQYRSATGYGCPDTAACDSTYYGFFNQVWMAALQFKRYAANPTGWNHIAGRVNNIRYHPNARLRHGARLHPEPGDGRSVQLHAVPAERRRPQPTSTAPATAAARTATATSGASTPTGSARPRPARVSCARPRTPPSTSPRERTSTRSPSLAILGRPVPARERRVRVAELPRQVHDRGTRSVACSGRSDGTIYFYDAGIKLPFTSCSRSSTTAAPARRRLRPADRRPALRVRERARHAAPCWERPAGSRYYVTDGQKREILDDAVADGGRDSRAGTTC